MAAPPLTDFSHCFERPVELRGIELLTREGNWFVRVRSDDGEGVAVVSPRMELFFPIFEQCVAPPWIGSDLRQLGECVIAGSNGKRAYKYGLPTWVCSAAIELACLDLLGKLLGQSVGDLAGGRKRDSVDVYLSHTGRHLDGEGEAELFAPRLEATGAKALKYKVGGRMSRNADAWPGRTQAVVSVMAKRFPDLQQWADANGSYDAATALEVAVMLAEHGVAVFEEPCPYDDYEATATVNERGPMMIAGGEQDHAMSRFAWQCEHRAVDILMPDPNYCGGVGRLLQVAAMAQQEGIAISPHSPMGGPAGLPLLHASSLVDNLYAFVEWSVHAPPPTPWCDGDFEVRNGKLQVPTGPGLGVTIDDDYLSGALEVIGLREA